MDGSQLAFGFTTRRERTLWLLAGAVVVAIYSTIGLATTLAGEFTNRDLLDSLAALGFLVLFTAVLLVGVKWRVPKALNVAIAAGVTAAYGLGFLRMASPIERSHLFEYSLLAILLNEALAERSRAGRGVARPGLAAFVAASTIGIVDELIQLMVPSRVFDPVDIGFNIFASFMGVAVAGTIGWAAQRRG